MLLVVVFLLLMLSLVGTTFRQMGSMLRMEAARSNVIVRDQGSLQAAAKALTMLENGPPPSDPYVITLGVMTSAGARSYQVTFASDPSGHNLWIVLVVPAPANP
jgi:hypothetical protein